MKHTALLLGLLTLVFALAAQAQTAASKPAPELKKLDVWVGDWDLEQKVKDSPSGAEYETTGTIQARWMGEFFLEWHGTETVKGSEIQWVEHQGYDPVKKRFPGAWFSTDGTRGSYSSVWSGNTEKLEGIRISPEGKEVQERCTWNLAPDWMSYTGTCERFTDGEWWTSQKFKATKRK